MYLHVAAMTKKLMVLNVIAATFAFDKKIPPAG